MACSRGKPDSISDLGIKLEHKIRRDVTVSIHRWPNEAMNQSSPFEGNMKQLLFDVSVSISFDESTQSSGAWSLVPQLIRFWISRIWLLVKPVSTGGHNVSSSGPGGSGW